MHWKRSCAFGIVMALASLSAAPTAVAECMSVRVEARTLLHDSDLVFAGTLLEGDQYTLTLQPDRTWKGKPPTRATVYVLGSVSVDSYAFRRGERYLVAARVLNEDERKANEIYDPAATVFGIERPCGQPLPLTLLPELDKLARPRTPAAR